MRLLGMLIFFIELLKFGTVCTDQILLEVCPEKAHPLLI